MALKDNLQPFWGYNVRGLSKDKGLSNDILLEAIQKELDKTKEDLVIADLQTYLKTAQGIWLDYWGQWLGLQRLGRDDETYRKALIHHVLHERDTIPALRKVLSDFLEKNIDNIYIYEPWRDMFIYNGSHYNSYKFFTSTYYRYAVIDVMIEGPLKKEINRLMNLFRPAGVFWVVTNLTNVLDKNAPIISFDPSEGTSINTDDIVYSNFSNVNSKYIDTGIDLSQRVKNPFIYNVDYWNNGKQYTTTNQVYNPVLSIGKIRDTINLFTDSDTMDNYIGSESWTTVNDASLNGSVIKERNGTWHGLTQNVTLDTNTPYTISAYARRKPFNIHWILNNQCVQGQQIYDQVMIDSAGKGYAVVSFDLYASSDVDMRCFWYGGEDHTTKTDINYGTSLNESDGEVIITATNKTKHVIIKWEYSDNKNKRLLLGRLVNNIDKDIEVRFDNISISYNRDVLDPDGAPVNTYIMKSGANTSFNITKGSQNDVPSSRWSRIQSTFVVNDKDEIQPRFENAFDPFTVPIINRLSPSDITNDWTLYKGKEVTNGDEWGRVDFKPVKITKGHTYSFLIEFRNFNPGDDNAHVCLEVWAGTATYRTSPNIGRTSYVEDKGDGGVLTFKFTVPQDAPYDYIALNTGYGQKNDGNNRNTSFEYRHVAMIDYANCLAYDCIGVPIGFHNLQISRLMLEKGDTAHSYTNLTNLDQITEPSQYHELSAGDIQGRIDLMPFESKDAVSKIDNNSYKFLNVANKLLLGAIDFPNYLSMKEGLQIPSGDAKRNFIIDYLDKSPTKTLIISINETTPNLKIVGYNNGLEIWQDLNVDKSNNGSKTLYQANLNDIQPFINNEGVFIFSIQNIGHSNTISLDYITFSYSLNEDTIIPVTSDENIALGADTI